MCKSLAHELHKIFHGQSWRCRVKLPDNCCQYLHKQLRRMRHVLLT